jgi:exopolyphosphatase/guanosine-5'-triphosphate,3'-diphosphate pyrophosphatase
VIEAVLELTEVDALEVTRAGLREGVFFASHLLAETSSVVPDVRAAAVRGLCRQHSVDLRRVEHVAELALGLHDSLVHAAAISAGNEERELLWAAAMLHEVGMAIDFDGHPLHSRYVLLNSELYGFGPREVALLAQIVRHHRKGTPSLDDLEWLAMPADGDLVARFRERYAELPPLDARKERELVARGIHIGSHVMDAAAEGRRWPHWPFDVLGAGGPLVSKAAMWLRERLGGD